MVIYDFQSRDKESVLKEMVTHILKFHRFEEDEDVLGMVLNRESLSSTGVGCGFAFPHARIKTQNGPIMCLGMSKEGIDFDSIDGKQVHIILMIIWKPEVPGLFNHLFGGIAKFLLENPKVKNDLLMAADYDRIARILSQFELQISSDHGQIQGAKLLLRLQTLLDEKRQNPAPEVLTEIEKEMAFIREELDPSILSRFDRLNERYGAGVFRIKDGVCQGCMIKLSTSLAATIQNSNDIFVCQKCGRYIVG